MEYSIGEVSSIVSLSRDMIRYYEKQGAVQSKRNNANGYRFYDTMEVFWLLEAMVHKSWGIPISEIQEIRSEQYAVNTKIFLDDEIRKREWEAEYNALYIERLRKVRDYASFGSLNIGNFWVEQVPASFSFHLVTGRGDEYDRINLPEEASRFIFSDRMLPFFDSGFSVNREKVDWEMRIEENYVRRLGAKFPEGFERHPEEVCLCSNVDMGEIGTFDPSVFRAILEYADEKGYARKEGEPVRGFILGRGYEDGHFRRIVRYFVPLEVPV